MVFKFEKGSKNCYSKNMKVYEFHFNPRKRALKDATGQTKLGPDSIFDSFCYTPSNIYEKRMGNLYLIGVLKNVLPQNLHFLDKLAKVIQKEYYLSIARKPEKALKEALKEANAFLDEIAKKGDVSWLGNLSFGVFSLKNYELNFTKVGDLKTFLLRGKRIIDIDRKLKLEEIAPWPLKIFGNIVSGKLAEDDVLLVSTKEVSDFFEKEALLPEIEKIWPFDEKRLKEIFNKKREEILKISGVCLVIVLTKEITAGKTPETEFHFLPRSSGATGSVKEIISQKSYPKEFNFKQVFTPYLKKIGGGFKKIKLPAFPRVKLPNPLKQPEIKLPEIRLPKLPKPGKKPILILALILFLSLGFFISQLQEKQELKERQTGLKEIQEKVNQAESFLILKTPQTEKEANLLLKESWEEISQLSKIISNLPRDFQGRVSSLKDKISQALFELNKLEIIEEPGLFFDFSRQQSAPYRNEVSGAGFVPQKMVFFKDEIYFFSPYSENLFKVDKDVQGEIIELSLKLNLAAASDDSILFLSKPNQLIILKEREPFSIYLEEPYPDFNFDSFATFRGNLYFLDSNPAITHQGSEIIRYPYLKDFEWGPSQLWLAEEEKTIYAKSLAVDGSVWLLASQQKNDEASLGRYYRGQLEEKIVLEIFPEPKEFKKIFTSPTLPYLYLLEPIQKRVVILDKKGQIVKQFQSQKFDNLLDFAVSTDGKIIWLLNGLKVYKILF